MGLSGLWSNQFPVDGRTAIITGGSQGMGKAVAKKLSQKGANVVIVARNEKKLLKAIAEIKSCASNADRQRFSSISTDLTDPTATANMIQRVTSWNKNQPPDIVWCCAGGSRPGFFVEMTTEDLRSQMDQNYFSTAYTCHSVLQSWLAPSSTPLSPADLKVSPRHLILTSSVVAFYTIAGYSAYSPTKAALRSLSDTLRQEVELYNSARSHKTSSATGTSYGPSHPVSISTIFPGTILTPGLEEENKTKPGITFELEKDDGAQTEDQVAASSIKGLERGEYLVTTKIIGQAMRGTMWGGGPRNYWPWDLLLSWIVGVVWLFVGPDLDRKVRRWGREKGHPDGYEVEDVPLKTR